MTLPADLVTCEACPARRSTSLPFDLADMIAVRLLPAQFARVVGVSKQSVSKWIRAGKVTLGPDGRLDPAKSIQEVLKNTAPTRLRARIFRHAMEGADAMRVEIRALQRKCALLESELAERNVRQVRAILSAEQSETRAQASLSSARQAARLAADITAGLFQAAVVQEFDRLVAERASPAGDLAYALGDIWRRVADRNCIDPRPTGATNEGIAR